MQNKAVYLTGKLIELILTLLFVSLLVFTAFSIIPGDTARVMLGPQASESQVALLRAELGLDKPLIIRYGTWIWGLLSFNPGTSYAYNMSVGELICQRLPVTIGMSALAMIMVILISYPLAVLSARKPGRLSDLLRYRPYPFRDPSLCSISSFDITGRFSFLTSYCRHICRPFR